MLLVSGILLGLVICELAVRVAYPQYTYKDRASYLDMQVFDLKVNFNGTLAHPDYKYHVSIDKNRLRMTKEFNEAPYQASILVLGDSFAFGTGLDDNETIASFISEYLYGAGHNAKVSNAACPGYTLAESVCKYYRVKSIINPDIVVIIACFNDSFANMGDCKSLYMSRRSDELERLKGWRFRFLYPFIRDFLLGNSQLAVLLAKRLNEFWVFTGLRASIHSVTAAYEPAIYIEEKERIEQTIDMVTALHAEIQRQGKVGIFVYIPGMVEVDDGLWHAATNSTKKGFVRDLPRRFLLQAARRAGYKHIIDILAAPRAKAILKKGYYPLDMHLNASGSAFVAKLITDEIITILDRK